MKLPPITEQPILSIDLTPTDDLAIRILKAYRQNCSCKWASDTDGSTVELNPLLKTMNDDCDRRAEVLDKAIKILES